MLTAWQAKNAEAPSQTYTHTPQVKNANALRECKNLEKRMLERTAECL